MSVTARVKSIEALGEWKGSLKRYVSETLDVLRSANQKIERTEDWLQERVSYWRHKVEKYEQEVWEAKRDLEYCEQDDDNDCSTEEETLFEAKRRLSNAREELRNVRNWKQRVDEVTVAYRVQVERLGRLLSIEMPRGDAFLGCVINELEAYVAIVSAPVIGLEAFTPVQGKTDTSRPSKGTPEETQQLHNGLKRLDTIETGREIAKFIKEQAQVVHFGQVQNDGYGSYNQVTDELILNDKLKNASPNVLAAHLAHEGTHAQWKGQHGLHTRSIDEEVAAFTAEVKVWREVKGSENNPYLDKLSTMMAEQENFPRSIIRKRYQDYDEHPTLLKEGEISP